MQWQLQLLLAWAQTPQAINLVFALVCLWSAFGLSPRRAALASAALYLALALI